MEFDFDRLKEQGLELAGRAKKTAQELAGKGRDQLQLMDLQAKLSKSQRQLGALVYSLAKAGESNQPLVDQYIAAIAEIEKSMDQLKSSMDSEEAEAGEEAEYTVSAEPEAEENEQPKEEKETAARVCPQCGAKEPQDALFCSKCGTQL